MPDVSDRLPRVPVPPATRLVWVGAHGGSGSSSLAALLPGSRALSRAWPDAADGVLPVLLVARTSADSLRAAQQAVVQWAAGTVPGVDLVGLVLVADRPGRLPRELRRLRDLVAGGVPQAWDLPWVEEWRRGAPPDPATAPGAHRRLLADLATVVRQAPAEGHDRPVTTVTTVTAVAGRTS